MAQDSVDLPGSQKSPYYKVEKEKDYNIVHLYDEPTPEAAKLFEDDMPNLLTPPVHIIVNCDKLIGLPPAWVRIFLKINSEVRKLNRDVRYILVSLSIQEELIRQGINRAIQTSLNLKDALVELKISEKKQLDTEFINPYLSAAMQVLKVQTDTVATPGKIYVKQDKSAFSGDISGSIGLITTTFTGNVVISFPEATFLKIMSRMLGEEFTTLTQDIVDGAGELTNMIFSQAKVVLNEKGYGIKAALPTITRGKNHQVVVVGKGPIVVIPFNTDVGPFFVEIFVSV